MTPGREGLTTGRVAGPAGRDEWPGRSGVPAVGPRRPRRRPGPGRAQALPGAAGSDVERVAAQEVDVPVLERGEPDDVFVADQRGVRPGDGVGARSSGRRARASGSVRLHPHPRRHRRVPDGHLERLLGRGPADLRGLVRATPMLSEALRHRSTRAPGLSAGLTSPHLRTTTPGPGVSARTPTCLMGTASWQLLFAGPRRVVLPRTGSPRLLSPLAGAGRAGVSRVGHPVRRVHAPDAGGTAPGTRPPSSRPRVIVRDILTLAESQA